MNKHFLKSLKYFLGKTNSLILNLPTSIKKPIINSISLFPFEYKYPYQVWLELTNACNLKCPLCPTTNVMKREKKIIPFEDCKKIIDNLSGKVKKICLGYAGEMSLHPQFTEIIKYAKKKGFNVMFSTNGTSKKTKELIESQPDEILFALDGISKLSYEQYRVGGKFEEVIENLRNLCKYKKELNQKLPYINVQFIVMKHNEHEIQDAIKLIEEIGADSITLKSVSLFAEILQQDKNKLATQYLPSNLKFVRYDKSITVNKPVVCPAIYAPLIQYNGDIALCCYDYDGKIIRGNIFQDGGFKKVWSSKRNKIIRKKIIKQELDLCKKCTMGIGGSLEIKFQ